MAFPGDREAPRKREVRIPQSLRGMDGERPPGTAIPTFRPSCSPPMHALWPLGGLALATVNTGHGDRHAVVVGRCMRWRFTMNTRQSLVYTKNRQELRNERETNQSRLSLHLAGVSAAWRLPGLQSLPPRPGREDHLREAAGEVRLKDGDRHAVALCGSFDRWRRERQVATGRPE